MNGEKANYSGYTKSEGIAIANLGWKPTKSIDYQIWNYYVDQLFNMVWNKAEYKWKVGERTVMAGIQYAWQSGRYLFPREWGIEPFYTFMQRERNEGAGDVHAANFQHTHFLDKSKNWEVLVAAGMYWMPSTNDARLNKYAMPSYYQLNARSRYRFNGFLRGLNLEVLYVYKGNMDRSIEVQPVYYHNKVDMHNLSVVIDYYF
ncbi:MAG: hypothetical protein IPK96_03825 [Flammeovirgaceae bacterium]|nr:hypothetical protein [Flammeovirgaceae bacterium]